MQGRDEVYSEKIRAGKRTYFFDVRSTRSNDYYITITESKRRFNGRGYDKHKIFLYKEDFNKFLASLNKTVDHVKTELLPDYDYDEFDRKREWDSEMGEGESGSSDSETVTPVEEEVAAAAAEVEEEAATEEVEADDTETSLSTSWED
ncbi:MAG: DUF3276 family protein [Bacteroidia bacterium]|nr:DUF3276 family protein [Bacteroidia bacterium]